MGVHHILGSEVRLCGVGEAEDGDEVHSHGPDRTRRK